DSSQQCIFEAVCAPLITSGVCSAQTLYIEHLRIRGGVAEAAKIAERPNHFFGAVDFDDLRIVRPRMTIAQNDMAVGQDLQRGHPGELNLRQVVLFYAPNDFLFGSHFQDTVAVPGGDERVAATQAQRGKDAVAEGLRTMSPLAFHAKEGNLVLPDDL